MAEKPRESFASDTSMRQRVEQALSDSSAREKTEIELQISGGLAHQSYDFSFVATGAGRASSSFRNRLKKSEGERSGRLKPRQFEGLLESCVQSGLLDRPPEVGPFLPDTLVGRLEIRSDGRTYRTYFAADPEQAKTQGIVPSASLNQVIDKIYAEGARILGKRSVRP